MTTAINVSLPENLKQFVEEQVQSGHYTGASDYIRALIGERRKSLAEDKLRARIAEGLASELSGPIDEDAYWAERRRTLEQAPGKQPRDS